MSQRKPIFDGVYEVSDDGRVFRVKFRGNVIFRELSQSLIGSGYYGVSIHRKPHYVHLLVLLAFKGPCPNGFQGGHLNGKKLDNRLENLDYITPTENSHHKLLHGTGSKYTQDQVREVRKLSSEGTNLIDICRTTGVGYEAVRKIASRKMWQYFE